MTSDVSPTPLDSSDQHDYFHRCIYISAFWNTFQDKSRSYMFSRLWCLLVWRWSLVSMQALPCAAVTLGRLTDSRVRGD